jgi:hypothetical protein
VLDSVVTPVTARVVLSVAAAELKIPSTVKIPPLAVMDPDATSDLAAVMSSATAKVLASVVAVATLRVAPKVAAAATWSVLDKVVAVAT